MRPLLVADVGGTHMRMALIDEAGGVVGFERIDTPDLTIAADLRRYLAERRVVPQRCVVGAAGPVLGHGVDARMVLTNRDLAIDARTLGDDLGCPVSLHNDVAALAAALPVIRSEDLDLLGGPPPTTDAARLAVALGTGCGVALLTRGGEVVPTEAGHATLPLGALPDPALRSSFTSVESLLSGPGWRRLTGLVTDPEAALDVFTDALARVCADLALITGAWGGVHLAGGLFAALAPRIDARRLRAMLTAGGPAQHAIGDLPLVAIRDAHATLRGLARLGTRGG